MAISHFSTNKEYNLLLPQLHSLDNKKQKCKQSLIDKKGLAKANSHARVSTFSHYIGFTMLVMSSGD